MSPSYVTKLLRTPFSRFSTFRFLSLFIFALALFLFPQNVYSVDVTLGWNVSSEGDLDGYRVFCRQEGQSYDYSDPDWEGSNTTCTIYNLNDNTTYYFVARSFDTSGNESSDSNEACYQPNVASTEGIIDNGDVGTFPVGVWNNSSGLYPYGNSSLYSRDPDGTYTFEASLAGPYRVSLWWTAASGRCTDVPVEVYDGDTLLETFYINQKVNGGKWNYLNTYDFTGRGYVVIRSQGPECSTCADAVSFISVDPTGIIIDNDPHGWQGPWNISSAPNPYGHFSLYSRGEGAWYSFGADVSGPTEICLWWTQASGRCTDVPVEVYDGDTLLETFYINQKVNGGKWNYLNTYDFTGRGYVVIRSQGPECSTCADAASFVSDRDFVASTEAIIVNPGFEDGTNPWIFFTNGQGDFVVSTPGHESFRAACITTDTGGTNIQLYQYDLSLEPNTDYQLSFSAYSNTGHGFSVSIFEHVQPYTNYGLSHCEVDLEMSWNTYSIDFTTPDFGNPVNDARLMFWFSADATAGDEYWIDNVVLSEID